MMRWAWLLAAGAAAVLGVLAVWSPVAPTRPSNPPALPAPVAAAMPVPTRATGPARAASAAVAPPVAADQPTTAVWDLCGIGRVPLPPGTAASAAADVELPAHLGALPAAELGERMLATLSNGTPRQRAAALMLNLDPERSAASAAQLAELALSAKDPVMYFWAWSRCQDRRPCGSTLALAWAAAEPANAAAWLALHQTDPARQAQARAGLAAARHFSLRSGSLAQEAMQAVPADAAPYLRLKLAEFAFGFDAAVSMPSVQPLTRSCKPAAPAGSERQAACSALTEMVVEHSDTLIGYYIGMRMAEGAGWPASRLAELRAERKRIEAVAGEPAYVAEQPLSCESAERFARFMAEHAELGELGYFKRKAALQQRR